MSILNRLSKWMAIVIFLVFAVGMVSLEADSDADAQAAETLSRLFRIGTKHMELARLVNAIHMQNHLEHLTPEIIIEGVWNLEAGTLTRLLEATSRAIEAMRPISGLLTARKQPVGNSSNPDFRRALEIVRDVVEKDYESIAHAQSLTDFQFTENPFKEYKVLTENRAGNALTILPELVDRDRKNETKEIEDNIISAVNDLVLAGVAEEKLLARMNAFLETSHNFDRLLDGLNRTRGYLEKFDDVKELEDELERENTDFKPVASFSSLRYPDIEAGFKEVRNFQTAFYSKRLDTSSRFAAFQEDRAMRTGGFSSSWLKSVLNQGEPLDELEAHLAPLTKTFSRFDDVVEKLKKNAENWRRTGIALLDNFEEFLKEGVVFSSWSNETRNVLKWKNCVPASRETNPPVVSDVKRFASQVSRFEMALRKVSVPIEELRGETNKWRQTARNLYYNLQMVQEYLANVTKLAEASATTTTRSPLKAPMATNTTSSPSTDATSSGNSTNNETIILTPYFVNTADLLATVTFARNIHGPLQKIIEFLEQHRSLNQFSSQEFKAKVLEAGDWMRTTNLMNASKCPMSLKEFLRVEPLQKFDVFKTHVWNVGSSDSQILKTFAETFELKAMLKAIVVGGGDKKANENASRFDLFETIDDRLIDTFQGIHLLYQMGRIHRHSREMETIQKLDGVVQKVLERKKTDDDGTMLEWRRQFEKVGKQLRTLMIQLNVTNWKLHVFSENSIADMIPIYKRVAEHFQFTGNTDISGLKSFLMAIDDRELDDVIRAMDVLEGALSIDWRLSHAQLRRMPEALTRVQETFDEYHGRRPADSDSDDRWITTICVFIVVLFLSALGVFAISKKRSMSPKNSGPSEPWALFDEKYVCKDPKFSYVQLQDSRQFLNRAPTRVSTLHQAISRWDFKTFQELINKKALLDPYQDGETPLQRLMKMKLDRTKRGNKRQWLVLLISAGASLELTDFDGNTAEMLGKVPWEVEKLCAEWKPPSIRTRTPDCPRLFKILVCEHESEYANYSKKLHPYIQSMITWGTEGVECLGAFTHIVIPQKFYVDHNTVLLDESCPEVWKYVALPAILMDPTWISALATRPKYLDNDKNYILTGTKFRGIVYPDALLELKTRIHKMMPGLLANMQVSFLRAGTEEQRKMNVAWMTVVHLLEGKLTAAPKASERRPFYTLQKEYVGTVPATWIVKFPGSNIKPKWKENPEKFALVTLRFLLTCIASNRILPVEK